MLPRVSGEDLQILAKTIYGEARGEQLPGQIAVGQVIMNRHSRGFSHYWNRGRIKSQRGRITGTCLTPYQFSCWNDGDPNLETLNRLDVANTPRFRDFIMLARLVTKHLCADQVGNATHYHHESIRPNWTCGYEPCAVIGKHWFYEGIK